VTEPKRFLPDTLSVDMAFQSGDTAIVLMKDLARRIAAGEVKIMAVAESTDMKGMTQALEITYVETTGTKQ
jgi:hypothetical protein